MRGAALVGQAVELAHVLQQQVDALFHALAGAARIVPALTAELGRTPTIVINLSGRGDKDVHTAGAYFGILDDNEVIVPGENA